MKIDTMSGYPVFRKNNTATPAKTTAATGRAGKTDVIDFSRGQTATPDQMATLKATILRDISQPANAQDLAALQNSVRAGSYRPSTDELVNAILGE